MTDKQGRYWQDSVIIGSIIGGGILIGLVLAIKPESKLSVSNNIQPQSSNQNKSQITPSNSPQSAISKLSPEESIKEQYSMINNHQYQKAWNRLSTNFRNNQSIFPDGFNSYVNWWGKVNYAEVKNIQIINQTQNNATVNITLKLHIKNGRISTENRQVNLLWNENTHVWNIDKIILIH